MKYSIKWHGSSLSNPTRAFIYGMTIVHFVLYHGRSNDVILPKKTNITHGANIV
jgi:hypothetical protein